MISHRLVLFSIVLLFFGSASAVPSYLGKADGQSVVIKIAPEGDTFNPGQKVKFSGTVKVIGNKSFLEQLLDWLFNKDKGLYEDFKKHGIDVVGTFPSSAIDISNNLMIQSTARDEFKFSFESEPILSNELNQFSIKIYNNHDKLKLKHLAKLQGKLERRLTALNDLKKYYLKNKALATVVAIVEREIELISSIRRKIEERLNSDDNLIADHTYPLQVDNKTSGASHIGTSINGFRYSIAVDPGNSFEKYPTTVTAKVSRVDWDPTDAFFKPKEKYEYVVELTRDGQPVASGRLESNKSSVIMSHVFNDLVVSQNVVLELQLFRVNKGKKKFSIGTLAHSVKILRDQVTPIWLSESEPKDLTYAKEFPFIDLKVRDPFGRINLSSLTSTVTDPSGTNLDVTESLTKAMNIDGDELSIDGVLSLLQEGSHQLKVGVSDTSGNQSNYAAQVIVDKTAPQISFGHQENFESPTSSFDLNVYLVDFSPVESQIYLNGVQVGYSFQTGFQMPLVLTPGKNTIRVTVTDKAGNTAEKTSQIIYDVTPPLLTFITPLVNQAFYTKTLPLSVPFKVSANEILSSAQANGEIAAIAADGFSVESDILINSAGTREISVSAKDLAGNQSALKRNIIVYHDSVVPLLTLNYTGPTITKDSSVPVKVLVTDSSPVWSKVIVNGRSIFETRSKDFIYPFELTQEGENTLSVVAVDEAGNAVESNLIKVSRDTLPPVLSDLVPADGSAVDSISIFASALASEKLKRLTLNNFELIGNESIYSGRIMLKSIGQQSLNWYAEDLAGNVTSISAVVDVNPKLLNLDLISVTPHDGTKLKIVGAPGAVRKGAEVRISTGILGLNGVNVIPDVEGAFQIVMPAFSEAKITATDYSLGESQTESLYFTNTTKLSGFIKDTTDTPLVGVTVKLLGTSSLVLTDANGVFVFDLPPTGDQTLVVDGSTAVLAENDRVYSTTRVSVNIGLGQSNLMGRAIYLTPLMKDGSQTPIVEGITTIVQDPHAPGVELHISASSAVFPAGERNGEISAATIPSSKATIAVPQVAVPTTVVALEPSGTKFDSRVKLVLPNDNDLPPGIEMVILSMNSSRGQWEIDGFAKVSDDGRSVVTEDGLGISHFSLVYAVPIKPLLTAVENPKLLGVDVSEGAMSTSVDLPSFKSLGNTITPKLIYKSAWASPTAYVSNIVDIPRYETNVKIDNNQVWTIEPKVCFPVFGCKSSGEYIRTELVDNLNITSWFEPEEIKSQFFVGKIGSDQITVDKPDINLPQDTLPGVVYPETLLSQVSNYKGNAIKSVLSYAVSLKDPESEAYLPSGIYPSLTRYQFKLKNLTLTTGTMHRRVIQNGALVTNNSINYNTDPKLDIQSLEQILPQDVTTPLLVQNKSRSEFGAGWKMNLTSQILNPQNNRILLEEKDGGLTTYTTEVGIETLFDGNDTQIDFDSAVDFTRYPLAAVLTSNTQGDTYISSVDLKSQVRQPVAIRQISQLSGIIFNQNMQKCTSEITHVNGQEWRYKVKAKLGGLVYSAGKYYGANIREHSLFQLDSGSFVKLIGREREPDWAGNATKTGLAGCKSYYWGNADDGSADPNSRSTCDDFSDNYFSGDSSSLTQYCTNTFGAPCTYSKEYEQRNNVSCRALYVYGNVCDPWYRVRFRPTYGRSFNYRVGVSGEPQDGSFNRNQTYTCYKGKRTLASGPALNNPKGTTVDGTGAIIIADYGNNVVRRFDLANEQSFTIAGTGENFDTVQPGIATQSSIFHPTAVVYDRSGYLYISSEKGYIRRMSPDGDISVFAGLALEDGGQLVDEGDMRSFAFNNPTNMALDEANSFLYVADSGNHRVVRIDFKTGLAATIAGNGKCEQSSGNKQTALNSSLCFPTQLGLDEAGNLLVVDSGHKKIHRIIFNFDNSEEIRFIASSKDGSTLVKKGDGSFVRSLRNGNRYIYGKTGKLISENDTLGNTFLYEYDNDNRLIKMIDPVGQTTNFSYSGGLLSSITDPAGRKTYLRFSGDNLAGVDLPNSTSANFKYEGNLLIEQSGSMPLKKYAYNEYKRLTGVQDAKGVWSYVNDTVSKTIAEASQDVAELERSGFQEGQVNDSVIQSNGAVTSVRNNSEGQVYQIKDPNGAITTIARNENGDPINILYPDGGSVSYVYDGQTGDLLRKIDDVHQIAEEYTYNRFGSLLSKVTNSGVTNYEYDSVSGLLLEEIGPSGAKVKYSYTSRGKLSRKQYLASTGESLIWSYEHDANGLLISETSPEGVTTWYSYDLAGNVILQKVGQEATQYVYDTLNRLVRVTSPKLETTIYSYNVWNQLEKVLDPRGNATEFLYDENGRVIAKKTPYGTYSYEYDQLGNLVSGVDANGQSFAYEYDLKSQLIKKVNRDGTTLYSYDARGNIVNASDSTSSLAVIWDTRGRASKIATQGNSNLMGYPSVELHYSYDNRDNMILLESQFGSIQSSFDNEHRVMSISNSWGQQFTFEYSSGDKLSRISRSGSATDFLYSLGGNLKSIEHVIAGTVRDYSKYSYDERELVSTLRKPAGDLHYVYDSNGQISSVNQNSVTIERFTYDSLGNRIQDEGQSYTYDTFQMRLTEDAEFKYFYDANGNLIRKLSKGNGDAFSYEYSAENRLLAINVLAGNLSQAKKRVTYAYDVLGRRIQKKEENFEAASVKIYNYVYDGDNVFVVLNGNGQKVATYTHNPMQLDDVLSVHITAAGVATGLARDQGSYYFYKDALGSITAISNENQLIQTMEYSVFGKLLGIRDGVGNDILGSPIVKPIYAFAGREWDDEVNLYFNRARFYDPKLGRFIQEDPDAGNLKNPISVNNKYTYAINNPALHKDPTGQFIPLFGVMYAIGVFVVDAAIVAAISATIVSSIQAVIMKGNFAANFMASWGGNFITTFGVALGAGAVSGALSLVGAGAFEVLYGAITIVGSGVMGYQSGGLLGAFTGMFGTTLGRISSPAIKEGVRAIMPQASDSIVNGISSFLKGIIKGLNSFKGNAVPRYNCGPNCNVMPFPGY